jgi:hypothetical protein
LSSFNRHEADVVLLVLNNTTHPCHHDLYQEMQLVDTVIYAEAATAAITTAETETEAGDDDKNSGTNDP